MQFDEDASGVKKIVIALKFTNNSPYPIVEKVIFDKTDEQIEAANVTRTVSNLYDNSINIAANTDGGQSQEITIEYLPKSENVNVDVFCVSMTIKFEKSNAVGSQPSESPYSLSAINSSGGAINLGTYDNKNVRWKCFAYSTYWYWLRSACANSMNINVTKVANDGSIHSSNVDFCPSTNGGLRVAFQISVEVQENIGDDDDDNASTIYSIEQINTNNGIIKMGKTDGLLTSTITPT